MWLTKQVVWSNLDAASFESAIELENRTQVLASMSRDSAEAMRAFVEKRPAVFTGEYRSREPPQPALASERRVCGASECQARGFSRAIRLRRCRGRGGEACRAWGGDRGCRRASLRP